jgi:hypothetical protein
MLLYHKNVIFYICGVYRDKDYVSAFTVRAGSSNANEGGTVHRVTKIIPHEKFNEEKKDYDIALLKVCTDLTYHLATLYGTLCVYICNENYFYSMIFDS